MTATRSASTANVTYRALQQWFKWMIAEDEIGSSPMERTTPPFVPDKAVPVLSLEQLRALVDSCAGRDLAALRDTAIIRLLLDSGGRPGEVAGLHVDDLDFEMDVAHATGKGSRPRALPFGDKTDAALARYLRARARDRQAGRPKLWLAEKNRGPCWPAASSRCSSAAVGRWTRGSPTCMRTCSATPRLTGGWPRARARPT